MVKLQRGRAVLLSEPGPNPANENCAVAVDFQVPGSPPCLFCPFRKAYTPSLCKTCLTQGCGGASVRAATCLSWAPPDAHQRQILSSAVIFLIPSSMRCHSCRSCQRLRIDGLPVS